MGSLDNATISGFLCRLCSDVHHVVFHVYGEVGLRHSIVQKINNYLPVTVSPTDRLPKTICKHCFEKVLAHHTVVKRMLARRKLFLANKHNTGNDAEKQRNESNEYTSRNIEDTIKNDHSYAQAERRSNSNSEQSSIVAESTTTSDSSTTDNGSAITSTITQDIPPTTPPPPPPLPPSSSELSASELNALPPPLPPSASELSASELNALPPPPVVVVSPTQNTSADCDIDNMSSEYSEDYSIMNVNNNPIETDSVSISENVANEMSN